MRVLTTMRPTWTWGALVLVAHVAVVVCAASPLYQEGTLPSFMNGGMDSLGTATAMTPDGAVLVTSLTGVNSYDGEVAVLLKYEWC